MTPLQGGASEYHRRRVVVGCLLLLLPLLAATAGDARADGDTRLGPGSLFAGAPGTAQTTEPTPHLSFAVGLSQYRGCAGRDTAPGGGLLLAVSLYQVYRAPVIPEPPSRPSMGWISGGGAVSATTLADIRVLQGLVAGVQKLVEMPAAVPAFAGAGGIVAQVGSPAVEKPQIDMHQRSPTPAQVARKQGASGTNSLGGRAPPGFRSTQTWNTSKNAKILRKNVEAERRRNGLPPIRPDEEVHHIEPSTSKFGEDGREVLDEQAIDINTAENGLVLKRGVHQKLGLHTEKAIRAVNDRLKDAADKGGRAAVLEELRRIADEILRGSFPKR